VLLKRMSLNYVAVCSLALLFACVSGLDDRWKLVWSDEFSGNALDTSKWTARSQPGFANNGEQEYYLPEQVSVASGSLILRSDNISSNGFKYRSGFVDTQGKFFSTYGRYEVSAKLPFGKGLWPAHWLLSEYKCWPLGSEIDILELLGDKMGTVHGTLHFGSCCGCNIGNGTDYTVAQDLSKAYHTYAVEWFPHNVTWFLDDHMYHFTEDKSMNNNKSFPLDPSPHYWILNTAVGGNWPGSPDKSTVFPQLHYIDYVRVYAWQPCVSGCGTNGCCEKNTGTCKCGYGWEGTTCEYNYAGISFNRNFASYDSAVETLGAGGNNGFSAYEQRNSVISNGTLTLTINNDACPTGCSGMKFAAGSWESVETYLYGAFTFRVKASSTSGTAVVLWGMNVATPFEAVQMTIAGNQPKNLAVQYWVNGNSKWVGEFALGFDASMDFHNYTFSYSAKALSFFVDGKSIATTDSAPISPLKMMVQFLADPQYYGAFSYTSAISARASLVSWVTNADLTPPAC